MRTGTKSLGLFAVAAVMAGSLVGCIGQADDGAMTGDDQEVVDGASAFDQIPYDLDLEVAALEIPEWAIENGLGCTATASIYRPGAFLKGLDKQTIELPSKKKTSSGKLAASIELPRYQRSLDIVFEVVCKDEQTRAPAHLVRFSLPDGDGAPKATSIEGKADRGTTSEGGAYGQRIVNDATTFKATLRPGSVKRARVSASNCGGKGKDVTKLYLRAFTDVTHEWSLPGWILAPSKQGPFGNDWEALLSVEEDLVRTQYLPRKGEPGVAVVEICRPADAGEKVHVSLALRENDIFKDDVYKTLEIDLAPGAVERATMRPLKQSSEGKPVGRDIPIQLELK